jgi:hypothetical protein
MSVSPSRARDLALALPDTQEAPHFDRLAFRTPRKMFATLKADGSDLNLMFDPDTRDLFCDMAPHAFSPVPGAWGMRGATRCDLAAVDEPTLQSALIAAHTMAAPKSGRGSAPRASPAGTRRNRRPA